MQISEFTGQVQPGKRLPERDGAFDDTRVKPASRAKRLGTEELGRRTVRMPVLRPVRYGAGF